MNETDLTQFTAFFRQFCGDRRRISDQGGNRAVQSTLGAGKQWILPLIIGKRAAAHHLLEAVQSASSQRADQIRLDQKEMNNLRTTCAEYLPERASDKNAPQYTPARRRSSIHRHAGRFKVRLDPSAGFSREQRNIKSGGAQ